MSVSISYCLALQQLYASVAFGKIHDLLCLGGLPAFGETQRGAASEGQEYQATPYAAHQINLRS
jgi:hypothetical protein